MKKIVLAGFVTTALITSASAQGKQDKIIKQYAASLSPAALKSQLSIIAGPAMEGRETASEGQRKAASYIESQMKAIGLQPGNGREYQLYYPVFQDSTLSSSININGQELAWDKDFTSRPENYTAKQTFSELIFLNTEDSAWKNDKISVAGKLVMVSAKAANERRGRFGLAAQITGIERKGAAAILIVDTGNNLPKVEPITASMRIVKYPASRAPNRYRITADIANMIMGGDSLEDGHTKTYQALIDLSFIGTTVGKQSSNVLGILPADKPTDQWLLITAHYDHLGKKDTVIWYGADDDGSGTATVIELAKAFAKAKVDGHGSQRNILFMTVSGEEKGLLGSRYYSEHPTIPLENVTANLNVDMIGRVDTTYEKKENQNYLYVVGDTKLSTDLPIVSKQANAGFNLELDPKYNDPKDRERIYYRSDHYNFAKKGVPVMFYYDGGNRDYHRPTDTVDKINFDLMSLRAKYIFTTAWLIAHNKENMKRDLELAAVGER